MTPEEIADKRAHPDYGCQPTSNCGYRERLIEAIKAMQEARRLFEQLQSELAVKELRRFLEADDE